MHGCEYEYCLKLIKEMSDGKKTPKQIFDVLHRHFCEELEKRIRAVISGNNSPRDKARQLENLFLALGEEA